MDHRYKKMKKYESDYIFNMIIDINFMTFKNLNLKLMNKIVMIISILIWIKNNKWKMKFIN